VNTSVVTTPAAAVAPGALRRAAIATALLVLFTLVFYSPMLWHQPILFDDPDYVFNNPGIKQGLSLDSLQWALTAGEQANWHPVTWLSHTLDWQLYGPWPPGHFATNILLHATNTGLVLLLLFHLTASLWRSLLVAILFALHPMHIESVAWISQRKELLACFFALLAIWAYADFTRRRRPVTYFLVALFYALSLMSKQSWVTLPALLLLLDYWPLRRLSPTLSSPQSTQNPDPETPNPTFPSLLLEKAPLLLLALAACALALIAQSSGGAVRNLEDVSLPLRLQNGVVNYAEFLRKLFWPNPISVYYPLPDHIPAARWLGSLALLALLTWSALRLRQKSPWLAVGWLWFLIGILPVIGFVQLSDQATADRYSYMPYLGLFIAIAWSLPDALATQSKSRLVPLATVGAAVLITMSYVSWTTLKEWANTRTLFTAAAARTHNNHLAYAILATQEVYDGQTDTAISNISTAVNLKPDSPRINLAAGRVYLLAGQPERAITHLEKALIANPNSPACHFEIARALEATDQIDLAIGHYTRTIQLAPSHSYALMRLAQIASNQGHLDEAERFARHALIYAKSDPNAWDTLGRILARQGEFACAITCFEKVLQLRPGDETAQKLLDKCKQALPTECPNPPLNP
jgi:protein O-mannosyl-transferase